MNGRKRQDWVLVDVESKFVARPWIVGPERRKKRLCSILFISPSILPLPPTPCLSFYPSTGRIRAKKRGNTERSIGEHRFPSLLVSTGSDGIECIASSEQILELFFSFERKMILWNFDWNCLSKFVKINRIKYSIYRWWRYTYIF